jgi:hypothetical protein
LKLDPNPLCQQPVERRLWAFIHDAICHPLVAITRYAGWAVRFHDYTSRLAWPEATDRIQRNIDKRK